VPPIVVRRHPVEIAVSAAASNPTYCSLYYPRAIPISARSGKAILSCVVPAVPPTQEELSNENILIVSIQCSDLEVNTLVWKCLGYRFEQQEGGDETEQEGYLPTLMDHEIHECQGAVLLTLVLLTSRLIFQVAFAEIA
jgi:hypothetical protein